MKYITSLIFALLFFPFGASAQNISASQLLKKSIKYHDPNSEMMSKELVFDMIETRPSGVDRATTIVMDVKKEKFKMIQERDSMHIESNLHQGNSSFIVNGKQDFSDEIKKNYKLNQQRLVMMNNYLQYLWLMPLKLEDEGTMISEELVKKDFFGKESLEMKVGYDPKVGVDVWYFYFDPSTYALIGYRFYHDESKNDGEYILFEGEVQVGKIRIPKERKWYMHKDDKYLGSDICKALHKS